MRETPAEIAALQELLDRSAASGGPHLSGIIDADRRLTAVALCERLTGMRLLTVATVTADGRPLTGAVDGYFLHGTWYFSTSPDSVRARHLRARPAVSATHLPGESLQVSVHGRAELFDFSDPAHGALLKQAMLDHYLPIQGPSFEEWINNNEDEGAIGARIIADKMFTFYLESSQ
ncbi:MAG TPA: pyridoxamine 5'-phosphate oxidase family protein [Mycobacteriales bacterium]|nr:pyridoxamine 5'-phosphate oxidase family protein [Mycobacteriales bacterium]